LHKDSIDTIAIYRFDSNSGEQLADSVTFTEQQRNEFIRKWNNSYPIGLCKYIPEFTITIKMKNGERRVFRINGRTIKERNDYAFRLFCNNDYFETIMKGNKKFGKSSSA
jgi:hypothetical protein